MISVGFCVDLASFINLGGKNAHILIRQTIGFQGFGSWEHFGG
jgi:hypothetical protein